jgi:hypothetical protein
MTLLPPVAWKAREASEHLASLDKKKGIKKCANQHRAKLSEHNYEWSDPHNKIVKGSPLGFWRESYQIPL